MGRALGRTLAAVALAVLSVPPPAAPGQKAPAVDLLVDASDLPVQIRKAVAGRVMVHELTLSDDYAKLQIQDPRRKENLDEYTYRDGKLGDPIPVKLSGDYTQEDLDAFCFPLESVDFALVPVMIQDAKQRLKMPEGKTSTLSLKRGWPFNNDVRWYVGVSDARHTGMVQYDLKGRKKEMSKQ
jgi:hypothetical protein